MTDLIASGSIGDGKYTPPEVVEGVFALTLHDGAMACLVSANASYALEDADGQALDASIEIAPPTDYELVLGHRPDRAAFVIFDWTNWCGGALKGPLLLSARLPQEPVAFKVPIEKSTDSQGNIATPPCEHAESRSVLAFPSGYWGRIASTGMSPCGARDLELETDGYASLSARDLNGDRPGIEGSVRFNRRESPGCTLTKWDKVELRDSLNAELDVSLRTPVDVADRNPRTIYGPSNGYEKYVWTNWCGGQRPGPLHLVWTLPADGGVIDWPVPDSTGSDGNIITPPCISPAPANGTSGAGATPTPVSGFSVPRTF